MSIYNLYIQDSEAISAPVLSTELDNENALIPSFKYIHSTPKKPNYKSTGCKSYVNELECVQNYQNHIINKTVENTDGNGNVSKHTYYDCISAQPLFDYKLKDLEQGVESSRLNHLYTIHYERESYYSDKRIFNVKNICNDLNIGSVGISKLYWLQKYSVPIKYEKGFDVNYEKYGIEEGYKFNELSASIYINRENVRKRMNDFIVTLNNMSMVTMYDKTAYEGMLKLFLKLLTDITLKFWYINCSHVLEMNKPTNDIMWQCALYMLVAIKPFDKEYDWINPHVKYSMGWIRSEFDKNIKNILTKDVCAYFKLNASDKTNRIFFPKGWTKDEEKNWKNAHEIKRKETKEHKDSKKVKIIKEVKRLLKTSSKIDSNMKNILCEKFNIKRRYLNSIISSIV